MTSGCPGASNAPQGRPLPQPGPGPAAGAARLRPVLASRARLAATVAPLSGPGADAVTRVSGALTAAGPAPLSRGFTVLLDTLARYRREEAVTHPGRIAALLVSSRDLPVRDLMDRPPINGARANVALDVALGDDPGYSMAGLLRSRARTPGSRAPDQTASCPPPGSGGHRLP